MADLTPPYVPIPPATLAAEAFQIAQNLAPGITSLPANLIGDMNATSAGSLAVINGAFVDLVNSISPYTANPTILYQLGNVYGVPQGIGSNTQVYVVFTGTPGFVINSGFIVSDGAYQYTVQEPAIIPTGGTSDPVYCLATTQGTWGVPTGTVTQIVTSIPTGIVLSVTNPTDGIPGQAQQSLTDYRAQVIQAGRAVATGLPTLVRTALQKVNGVSARLISIRQVSLGWEIIVGGGDPYSVANAIFQSMFNIQDLQGASSVGTTQNISIVDYPDTYSITFVVPAQDTVTMTVNWVTANSANYVSNAVVTAAVQKPLQDYINSIPIGSPISELELYNIFLAATSGILDPTTLIKLTFDIYINAVLTPWPMGEVAIFGDPEAYFYCPSLTSVTVTNIP